MLSLQESLRVIIYLKFTSIFFFSDCLDKQYGCTGCHTGPVKCHAKIGMGMMNYMINQIF